MDTAEDAEAAISQLNQTSLEGKTMTVAHVSCMPNQYGSQFTLHRRDEVVPGPPLLDDTTVSSSRTDPATEEVVVEDTTVVAVRSDRVLFCFRNSHLDRPYQPRSYDSRYSDRGPPRCELFRRLCNLGHADCLSR